MCELQRLCVRACVCVCVFCTPVVELRWRVKMEQQRTEFSVNTVQGEIGSVSIKLT